ncbi:MAG: thiol:disulfide interchange protein DsbA/DsbL [Magnetococcales bacterium]|nr:thiol:disulfide interchange protein DsbA/DsbL [Magnetococcales bacterium]
MSLWALLIAWLVAIPPSAQAETGATGEKAVPIAPPAANTSSLPRFADLVPGQHYIRIQNPSPIPGNKPQISEVFNFKCPHCFHLHAVFEVWAEKNRGRFDIHSLPMAFEPQSDRPVRAYFTALFMGKGKEMKNLLFKANFVDSLDIENQDVIAFLAEEIGLKVDPFKEQMSSFGVVAKVSQAKAQAHAFGITGTPSVVVNGRYLVHGSHTGGDWNRLLAIVETLSEH